MLNYEKYKTVPQMLRGVLKVLMILFMLPLINNSNINAQTVSKVGTTAATFLKIGVGARALAMGEAYTTIAEDVTGLYWNPAGIANVDKIQFLVNHYDYIADIYYDFGGVVLPMSHYGTFGIYFSYLGMPDIERTTLTNQYGTGEMVSASSFCTGLSYGKALTDRFNIGGTVKYIKESLWHTSASSMALDMGILYTTNFKNVKLGMSISNFGNKMQLSGRDLLIQHDIDVLHDGNNSNINADLKTDKFSLPMLFRVGMSANIAKDFLGMEDNNFIIAVNALHPNDNFEYLNIGTEYSYKGIFALRGGYRQLFLEDSEGGLTLGMGLHFDIGNCDFTMDYAAVDFGRLDYLNKFSLIFAIK